MWAWSITCGSERRRVFGAYFAVSDECCTDGHRYCLGVWATSTHRAAVIAMAEAGSKPDPSSAVTAAVKVKPPAFDDSSVTRWFKIVESQFLLARITVSSTKFHHIIANLPVKVLNQLSDSVIASESYDDLKKALEGLFTKSKPELFDTLVNQHRILCTKPTLYLQDLRKISAPLDITDDFLRIKFLKALPDNLRPVLASYDCNTSLEELARVADTLLEYGGGHQATSTVNIQSYGNHVSYVGNSADSRGAHYASVQPYQPNRGSNTQGSTTSVPDYSQVSTPIGVRAFHAKQRPKVCRYHLYYGKNAKSCKSWCVLSSPHLNILPNSRSSSPAPRPESSVRSGN